MSYNKATAEMPLTGNDFDEVIINEREQRHMLTDNGMHVMPTSEYCELRDAYIQRNADLARLTAENAALREKQDGAQEVARYFMRWWYHGETPGVTTRKLVKMIRVLAGEVEK